jgi:hypothetical protein
LSIISWVACKQRIRPPTGNPHLDLPSPTVGACYSIFQLIGMSR